MMHSRSKLSSHWKWGIVVALLIFMAPQWKLSADEPPIPDKDLKPHREFVEVWAERLTEKDAVTKETKAAISSVVD